MNKTIRLFISISLISILLLTFIISANAEEDFEEIRLKGKVIDVKVEETPDSMYFSSREMVEVQVTEKGEYEGEIFTVENAKTGNDGMDISVSNGDKVLLLVHLENGEIVDSYLEDHYRMPMIYILAAVFIVLVLLIGRMKGLRSLITLLISIALIILILVPQAIEGRNPVILSIVISILAIASTFLIVSGVNRKSLVAILGTVGGIVTGGILAFIFTNIGHLTGMSLQESQMLSYAPVEVVYDFKGLLLASIIIGSLGAIMDIGMSIASSMYEIKMRAPEISAKELLSAGLNIGQDVMGTMINTLILAYAGASLPLLMVFDVYDMNITAIINMDLMATEIVRALAGSIGLIICIPLTALFAVLIYTKSSVKEIEE
ncbi:MAG: YibE/F family protein [Clostridia bacterium]